LRSQLPTILVLLIFISVSACDTEKDESYNINRFQTISLLGDSLSIPKLRSQQHGKLIRDLKEAQSTFEKEASEDNYVWLGRRWAYLGDYRKALSIYSAGIIKYPQSYKLYRHRGHRHISLREFDLAIEDFERAYDLMPKDTIEIEPDGIPNKINQPLSNAQFNIMYHWALAYYLKGEFKEALPIYRTCLEYSVNNDLLIATSDWLYMTLRRLEREQEAFQVLEKITHGMEVIENDSYYKRLLMYKKEIPIDSLFNSQESDNQLSLVTQGYGVANWYLYQGDTISALKLYQDILTSPSWSPFGYIAAESDLASLSE
jgi:tetratricopeptide (TPR) repeat protein